MWGTAALVRENEPILIIRLLAWRIVGRAVITIRDRLRTSREHLQQLPGGVVEHGEYGRPITVYPQISTECRIYSRKELGRGREAPRLPAQ